MINRQEQITGRILVIDDESEIRKLFIKKLAGKGYEIIEACDGKEGLKLYHENPAGSGYYRSCYARKRGD